MVEEELEAAFYFDSEFEHEIEPEFVLQEEDERVEKGADETDLPLTRSRLTIGSSP